MKFVISYSCGKDSTLALHKTIAAGHEPVGLIVMYNEGVDRSWFHGVDPRLLDRIAEALEIPLILCPASGEKYHLALEEKLRYAVAIGAEMCVFGDIDIEDHAAWCRERCKNAGIRAGFPLWQRNRRENTEEAVNLGYKCLVKCINNKLLPRKYLGREIDCSMIDDMEKRGIDVCGENGEYHTIVLDGPIFKKPVEYTVGDKLDFGDISVVDIH